MIATVLAGLMAVQVHAEPGWQMTLDGNGLPVVMLKGTPVLTIAAPFWAQDWKWAACDWRREPAAPGTGSATVFHGTIPALGVEIRSTVRLPAAATMVSTSAVTFSREMTGVIGGGYEFHLDTASLAFGGKTFEPVLADDRRSIVWDCGDFGRVTIEFEPALAALYFEKGQKHIVRAFFVPTDITPGTTAVVMTLRLPAGAVYSLVFGTPMLSHWFILTR